MTYRIRDKESVHPFNKDHLSEQLHFCAYLNDVEGDVCDIGLV